MLFLFFIAIALLALKYYVVNFISSLVSWISYPDLLTRTYFKYTAFTKTTADIYR